MSDGDPAPPPLQSSVLDDATLDRLLEDIAAAAEGVLVTVKRRRDAHAEGGEVSIADVASLLRSGSAAGVQLRYRFDGTAWCDTLIAAPEGVRLVRIEVPASPSRGGLV